MTRSTNRRVFIALLAALSLAAVPAVGAGPAPTSEATFVALRGIDAPALRELHAGASVVHVLPATDHAEPQRADSQSSDLGELRAGELSDGELLIVGVAILAVILLILIL